MCAGEGEGDAGVEAINGKSGGEAPRLPSVVMCEETGHHAANHPPSPPHAPPATLRPHCFLFLSLFFFLF